VLIMFLLNRCFAASTKVRVDNPAAAGHTLSARSQHTVDSLTAGMTVPQHCIPVIVVEDMEGPRSNRQQYDLPEEQERGQSHRNLHGNDVASQLDPCYHLLGDHARSTHRQRGVAGHHVLCAGRRN